MDVVTAGADEGFDVRALQQFHERQRRFVVGAGFQQHRVLPDGRVQRLRHHPHRTTLEPPTFEQLRHGHERQLGVAGESEVVGLTDALALHQFWRERSSEAEFVDHFDGGGAIRRRFGVGNGQLAKTTGLEHSALPIHLGRVRRPQHQLAAGVSEATAGLRQAIRLQLRGRFGVGREQHVKWRAVPDLRVQPASGTHGDLEFVTGGFFQHRSNGLDGLGKVGRHRHLGLGGVQRTCHEDQPRGQQ